MTQQAPRVRPATLDDSAACADIYEYYVLNTPITFEIEPPTVKQMAVRMLTLIETHAWLVLEQDEQVIGYAYGAAYASREAYQWSCETSVYLDKDWRGRGGGTQLYTALFAQLTERGFRQAVAGITMPNEASLRLHEAFGFEVVGTFKDIGWKFEQWHDVLRLQRPLGRGNQPAEDLT